MEWSSIQFSMGHGCWRASGGIGVRLKKLQVVEEEELRADYVIAPTCPNAPTEMVCRPLAVVMDGSCDCYPLRSHNHRDIIERFRQLPSCNLAQSITSIVMYYPRQDIVATSMTEHRAMGLCQCQIAASIWEASQRRACALTSLLLFIHPLGFQRLTSWVLLHLLPIYSRCSSRESGGS